MRSPIFVCILSLVACGNDSVDPGPDGPSGNRPDPRVIAGGGIGDGAIDGVVNLYVIDDTARTPIANAEVRVGAVAGTTDATGLFVAEGVVGPQDIVVKAPSRRAEMWLAANGANITVNLELMNVGTPPSANLTGSITGLVTGTLPANHAMLAIVSYSQTDDLGDPANELAQPAGSGGLPQNLCFVTLAADPCAFTVTSRTGKVALVAAIFDFDTKGTATEADDTQVLVGWAVRQGITVVASSNQTVPSMSLVPVAMTQTMTVDFGTPPANLTQRGALLGIDLGDEGVLQLPAFVTPAAPTLLAPKLAAISGATGFRLTGIASDGAVTDAAQSVVLRRALTGTTLAAGEWLSPPTGVSLTKTGGSWTNSPGATVHGVEFTQGGTNLLNVTTFDSSQATFTLPDLLLPLPSGAITATLNAIGADGLDPNSFSLDADRDKLDRVGAQAKTLN